MRDPNAVKLLAGCARRRTLAPTTPAASSISHRAEHQQHAAGSRPRRLRPQPKWRLTGRYTHDLARRASRGGLFFGTSSVPNVADHRHRRARHRWRRSTARSILGGNRLNELQYQFSQQQDRTTTDDDVTEQAVGVRRHAFPSCSRENIAELIPSSTSPAWRCSARISCSTSSTSTTRSPTTSRGSAATTRSRSAASSTFEQKNENANNQTQGRFTFVRDGRRPRPRSRTSCPATATAVRRGCTYTEAQTDVTITCASTATSCSRRTPGGRARTSRSTTASATRSIRRSPTRTTCCRPSTRRVYIAAKAPTCANAAVHADQLGTGDPLNGIIVAGINSPFGDAHLRDRQEQLPAARRRLLGSGVDGETIYPRRLRHLLTISRWSASSSRTRSPTRRIVNT